MVGDPEVKNIKALVTTACDCTNVLEHMSRLSLWVILLKVVARIKRLSVKQKCCTVVTVKEYEGAAESVGILPPCVLFHQHTTCPLSGMDQDGRLEHSSLSEDFRHPLILPKDSHVTQLIISHYHLLVCHQGRSQTQMELRSNGFWIISCSKLVAKLIHKCVQCRKFRRPVE